MKKKPKKQVTQKYNLTTFSDVSLRVIVEKSTNPAMVEAAKAVLRNRNVPYPTPITKKLGALNLIDMVRKCFAITELIVDHQKSGGKVVLQDKDGKQEVLKLL